MSQHTPPHLLTGDHLYLCLGGFKPVSIKKKKQRCEKVCATGNIWGFACVVLQWQNVHVDRGYYEIAGYLYGSCHWTGGLQKNGSDRGHTVSFSRYLMTESANSCLVHLLLAGL